MSKRELDIHIHRFGRQVQTFKEQIDSLEQGFDYKIAQLRKTLSTMELLESQIVKAAESYRDSAEREAKRPIRDMERKVKDLQKQLAKAETTSALEEPKKEGLDKAKTFAIFDAIIFAISNWCEDGDTAPDIELVCQSVLFPCVYERVMTGHSDYTVETVPVSAPEIVRRGREFIRYIRSKTDSSLTQQETWDTYAHEVQAWWINDALPLVYGARDPKWEDDTLMSLTEVIEWRDRPASRALHFPLLFDGMELVERFRDEIRESTGLPDFNRNTIDTRLPRLDERHQGSGNLGE